VRLARLPDADEGVLHSACARARGLRVRTAPNKQPTDVQGFRLGMIAGSHHFVLWEYFRAPEVS
jgi:hypothetical protein